MIPVEHAISRFRRDLTFAGVLRGLLLGGAAVCILFGPFIGGSFNGSLLLVLIAVAWLVLSYHSVKGSRMAADSPALIATGQFDEAERRIETSLRSFSLFRAAKLLSLHHLAVLRHAQRRWQEAAALCRAILGQRLGSMQNLSKPSRLILADAMLELGDLRAAHEALAGLYTQRLSLGEAMNLQLVQIDYLARIGAWEQIVHQIVTKVQLAELMPAPQAARAQAFLALAARKIGRADWTDWLRRRVELLVDVQHLCAERPILWELWEHSSGQPASGATCTDA